MPSFTTNQKIALAVSVPVAGVLLYVLLKWAREDDEFVEDTAEEADEFTASSDLVSEFQIQQSHVGPVIGRGGSVIKQIQKESQTRINFKDDDSESGDEVSEEMKQKERTMLIRGSRERIKQAEVLIQNVIDEQPVLEKAKVEIPQRLIGLIIGKGGKTIRQLCRVSGARIKIDRDNEMGEVRTCDIVGTETQIECAKQLIDEKISEDKAFRAKKNNQDAKDKLTFAHLPADGDYFGVYVSAMDKPGHFWIQNVTKNSKELDDLVEEMTQYYGDRGQGHRLIPPKVGDLCCATFQHDEAWYRGEIVEVMEESSQVRLHYLDFGDTGLVPMSNVKEIRKEFCYLPFQGIECYLANVKAKGDKWSREACEAFEKLSYCAQWKVLMARVVYYDENGLPCVQLFDTTGEQDVNIEKKLVEEGFAVYKEKTSNEEKEYASKASKAAVEQIIAEQKESTLEQMNDQFRSPGFENVSFDTDRSESFEFASPVDSSSRLNDKAIVSEPTITPVEHQVVSCADISQLGALFDKLNVDSNASIKDGEGLENSKTAENFIPEELCLDEKDSRNIPVEIQEGSVFMNALNNSEGEISENLFEEFQEHGLESAGSNSENDSIRFPELQEHSGENHTASDQVSRNSDEAVSEMPITSSVADNAQESYGAPITFSDAMFTEHAPTESTFEEENLPDSAAMCLLKHDENQKNDELTMITEVFNMPSEMDHPITSAPEYDPSEVSETAVKPISAGYVDQEEQNIGMLENSADPADYVLRRSYSEDLKADDILTNGAVTKSSSEIAVSPSKDFNSVNSKTQLSSRSLGSLSSFPKGGKRVLAANFGQIPNHAKPQSDDDEDDDDSIYLSAVEDSDSTGFLSAVGSRSNLRIDTDSDATPSGYLSEPEDSSIEIGGTGNVEEQARLDTTLLVEKLEQYADK